MADFDKMLERTGKIVGLVIAVAAAIHYSIQWQIWSVQDGDKVSRTFQAVYDIALGLALCLMFVLYWRGRRLMRDAKKLTSEADPSEQNAAVVRLKGQVADLQSLLDEKERASVRRDKMVAARDYALLDPIGDEADKIQKDYTPLNLEGRFMPIHSSSLPSSGEQWNYKHRQVEHLRYRVGELSKAVAWAWSVLGFKEIPQLLDSAGRESVTLDELRQSMAKLSHRIDTRLIELKPLLPDEWTPAPRSQRRTIHEN